MDIFFDTNVFFSTDLYKITFGKYNDEYYISMLLYKVYDELEFENLINIYNLNNIDYIVNMKIDNKIYTTISKKNNK